jgi:hypothetical protein
LLHLPLRWLIRSRAFFSWPSFIYLVLIAGQVFGWRFLKINANVRRDARGMMKSAGVDLSTAGGLVEVIQDLYVSPVPGNERSPLRLCLPARLPVSDFS